MYCIYLTSFLDDPQRFPFTASQVCTSWRDLAFGMHILWTDLAFNGNRHTVDKNTAWAERSGDLPLDIHLQNTVFEKSSIKRTRRILRLLKAEAHRIRILDVDKEIPMKIRRMLFDGLRGVNLPRLHELRAEMDVWNNSRRWKHPFFENQAPNIRRLAIRQEPFEWSSSLIPGLVAFRITLVPLFTPAVAHGILTRASGLKSLIIRLYHEVPPEWSSPDSFAPIRIVHHTLTNLNAHSYIIKHLIRKFRLPALRYLEINDCDPWTEDPFPGPTPPLNEVAPSLQRLTLYVQLDGDTVRLETKISDWLIGFSTMPSITKITFTGTYFADGTGEESIFGRFGSRIPPCVDTVVLDAGWIGCYLASAKEFVMSRMDAKGVAPVRSLTLKPENWKQVRYDPDLEWLRNNVEEFIFTSDKPWTEGPFWGDF